MVSVELSDEAGVDVTLSIAVRTVGEERGVSGERNSKGFGTSKSRRNQGHVTEVALISTALVLRRTASRRSSPWSCGFKPQRLSLLCRNLPSISSTQCRQSRFSLSTTTSQCRRYSDASTNSTSWPRGMRSSQETSGHLYILDVFLI